MKKSVIVLALVLSTFSVIGQNISGIWSGSLNVNGAVKNLELSIKKSGKRFQSSFNFTDGNQKKVYSETTLFSDSILTIFANDAKIQLLVNLTMDHKFIGVYRINNDLYPLELTKVQTEAYFIKKVVVIIPKFI